MRYRHLLAAALTMTLCQPAAAEETWYLGLGAAFSHVNIDAGAAATVDDKGDGLKLYGGWQPSRYFALELGYTDFGRVSAYSTFLAPASRDTVSTEWDGYGIDVSALGHWWIGDVFSLFARGGASAWDLERKVVGDGTSGHFVQTGSASGVVALIGAGVAFRFVQQGTLRAEFQRYFKVGGEEVGGKADFDVVSISAHYHF